MDAVATALKVRKVDAAVQAREEELSEKVAKKAKVTHRDAQVQALVPVRCQNCGTQNAGAPTATIPRDGGYESLFVNFKQQKQVVKKSSGTPLSLSFIGKVSPVPALGALKVCKFKGLDFFVHPPANAYQDFGLTGEP